MFAWKVENFNKNGNMEVLVLQGGRYPNKQRNKKQNKETKKNLGRDMSSVVRKPW